MENLAYVQTTNLPYFPAILYCMVYCSWYVVYLVHVCTDDGGKHCDNCLHTVLHLLAHSILNLLFTEIKDKTNKKPKVEKKEPESPKIPKIPLMDPKSVRANAKKALFQTLWKRYVIYTDGGDTHAGFCPHWSEVVWLAQPSTQHVFSSYFFCHSSRREILH